MIKLSGHDPLKRDLSTWFHLVDQVYGRDIVAPVAKLDGHYLGLQSSGDSADNLSIVHQPDFQMTRDGPFVVVDDSQHNNSVFSDGDRESDRRFMPYLVYFAPSLLQ